MSKSMLGVKVAVLAANGVTQDDLTAVQKALAAEGASLRLISTDQGLVNGWDGRGWGHNFAVDAQLNTALGVDYDCLIIPGGQRSVDKLKLTAHTKRFIGSFMAAHKPVAVMGDALQLMVYTEQLAGRTVGGPEGMKEAAERAGAIWSSDEIVHDHSLMSGDVEQNRALFIEEMIKVFNHPMDMQKQAA